MGTLHVFFLLFRNLHKIKFSGLQNEMVRHWSHHPLTYLQKKKNMFLHSWREFSSKALTQSKSEEINQLRWMPFRCSGLPVKFQTIVPKWTLGSTRCRLHLCVALRQPFLPQRQATIYSFLFAVGFGLWNQRRPGLRGGRSLNLTSACEERRE